MVIHRYTSDQERQRRMDALRSAMSAESLDALVVAGAPDIRFRGRIFYLTDYWQLLADSHVAITEDDGPIYVGNLVWGLSQAKQSDWITENRISGTPGLEVGDVLEKRGVTKGRIGLVGLSDGGFAHQHVEELRKALPGAELVDATELFERVRQSLSEEELANMEAVSENRRQIFDKIREYIRPGIQELDLAAQGHRICREHGLRDPMVLVWSTPHIGATSFGERRPIAENAVVTVWIESPDTNGYWLEYRECYSLGPAPAEYKEYWDLYTRALNAGLDKLRPGNMASEFAIAVKEVMATGGYKVDFPHPDYQHQQYTLHGIGTDAIQGVWTPGKDRELVENEMVNVHPVMDFDSPELVEKFGSFGVTDNVLVTPNGGQWMTHDSGLSRGFVEL